MRNYDRQFQSLITSLVNDVEHDLVRELQGQGHTNTGKLINSFKSDIVNAASQYVGEITGEDYLEILDKGVKPNRVPFSPGSGRKTSKFIDALVAYFRTKGKDEKFAKRLAFMTARVMKRQGIPTKRSFRYSVNGRRTGVLNRVEVMSESKIARDIETFQEVTVNDLLNEMQLKING